jgi:hypothetical protein
MNSLQDMRAAKTERVPDLDVIIEVDYCFLDCLPCSGGGIVIRRMRIDTKLPAVAAVLSEF